MAFIQSNQNEEEEDKNLQPGQSGDSSGILSAGSADAPQAGSNKKQSFATLQSYLKPNKVQGEQLATQVASNTAKIGETAKTGVESAANTVGSQVQQNTIKADQGLVDTALSNPREFIKNPENISAYTKQRDAAYTGPANFETTAEGQAATADVTKANEKAKLLDSESGRKTLLADTQQNKATGITGLNQALLSTNPNATATLQGAKGAFSGLQSLLSGKAGDINSQIAAAQSEAETAKQYARQKGAQTTEAFKSGIDQKLSAIQGQQPMINSIIEKVKAKQPLTPEQATYFRINADYILPAINAMFQDYGINVDAAPLVNMLASPAAVSREQVAAPEDFETADALSKLVDPSFSYLNPTLKDQAGTVPSKFLDYNEEASRGIQNQLADKDLNTINNIYGEMYFLHGGNPDNRQLTDPAEVQKVVDKLNSLGRQEEARLFYNAVNRTFGTARDITSPVIGDGGSDGSIPIIGNRMGL